MSESDYPSERCLICECVVHVERIELGALRAAAEARLASKLMMRYAPLLTAGETLQLLDEIERLRDERDSVQAVLDGFRGVAKRDNEYLIGQRDAALARVDQLEAAIREALDPGNLDYGHFDVAVERVRGILSASLTDTKEDDR